MWGGGRDSGLGVSIGEHTFTSSRLLPAAALLPSGAKSGLAAGPARLGLKPTPLLLQGLKEERLATHNHTISHLHSWPAAVPLELTY